MKDNLAKIRTALEWGEGPVFVEALAALAELEKSAAEPVAWMWDDMLGISHTYVSPKRPTWPDAGASPEMEMAINVRPLYEAPPAEIREVVVTDEMCDSAYLRKWESQTSLSGAEPDDEDRQWAREWLAAWRAELGPTLGMVELKEPTPEECERISMAYYDDEALVDRDHRHLGKDMFDACRAVMWPKEGL